jgi:hypothetical protein
MLKMQRDYSVYVIPLFILSDFMRALPFSSISRIVLPVLGFFDCGLMGQTSFG